MNTDGPKSALVRFGGVFCFMLAVPLLAVASWLFAEGELPAISLGDRSFMAFGGLSINGFDLPNWSFYVLPAGLCLVSAALLILGFRMMRVKA